MSEKTRAPTPKTYEVVVSVYRRQFATVTVQGAADEREAFAEAKQQALEKPDALLWQLEPLDFNHEADRAKLGVFAFREVTGEEPKGR